LRCLTEQCLGSYEFSETLRSVVVVKSIRIALAALSIFLAVQAKPPAQAAASKPVEVNVVSLPTTTAPVNVKVISAPKDDSGDKLVASTDRLAVATEKLDSWTAGVFAVTALLALITLWVSKAQSRELARRDKDMLARAVHRAAHRLRLDAEQTRLFVTEREERRIRVGTLTGNSGGDEARKVFATARDKEVAQLSEISASTDDIAGPGVDAFDVLGSLSAADLAKRQWALDRYQALVDVMRDAAGRAIEGVEAERLRYLNEAATMRAAKMANSGK
jgi:hypothetical protein